MRVSFLRPTSSAQVFPVSFVRLQSIPLPRQVPSQPTKSFLLPQGSGPLTHLGFHLDLGLGEEVRWTCDGM